MKNSFLIIDNNQKKNILKRFKNKHIAVLYGGLSDEREVSLRSGKNVFNALTSFDELKKNTILIDVKDGYSFVETLKKNNIEYAFNILHGTYGEDGTMQGLLEILKIPYTGENVLVSSLCMDKIKTKEVWENYQIPSYKYDRLDFIFKTDDKYAYSKKCKFKFPFILKPVSSGSSVGVYLVHNLSQYNKIKKSIQNQHEYLIEEYIKGREITVGVVKKPDTDDVNIFPILGIFPKNEVYDYEAKYIKGMTDFEIPLKIDKETEKKIKSLSKIAYNSLGCRGLCRFDAVLDNKNDVYFLECNTQSGMTETSDIPEMAKCLGLEFSDIVLYMLGLINEK